MSLLTPPHFLGSGSQREAEVIIVRLWMGSIKSWMDQRVGRKGSVLTAVPFELPPVPEEPAGPEPSFGPTEVQIYRACRFLKEVLASGPLPSTWVMDAGKALGLPERTLRRARSRLNIRVLHSGGFGKGTRRFMALPTDQAVASFEQRKKGRSQQQKEEREAALQRMKEAMRRFEPQQTSKQEGAEVS